MLRIYVDTSAVLPMVFHEAVSERTAAAFQRFHHHGDGLVTSALTAVEAARATRARRRREGTPDPTPALHRALAGVAEIAMDARVLIVARTIGPDVLRSLDAIHLATAVTVSADVMFTYDARLADAARDLGMAIEPA